MAKVESLVKEISGLSVLELAQLTKELEGVFGVSAAMMAGPATSAAAPAADNAAAAKSEEKSEYKVELVEGDYESNKIKIIKALRQVKKDLGLTEAKKMVEEAPAVIAEAVSAAEAKAMKEALEAAGAKVKLS